VPDKIEFRDSAAWNVDSAGFGGIDVAISQNASAVPKEFFELAIGNDSSSLTEDSMLFTDYRRMPERSKRKSEADTEGS